MKTIFAVDPGTSQSAVVEWDGQKVHFKAIMPNRDLMDLINETHDSESDLCIEMIQSFGMPVGRETFETVLFIGRLMERWMQANGKEARLVYRKDVKIHHCGNMRAKDANIRQALIDKYGEPGVKKNPGITYGITSHLWSAFAIATYVAETSRERQQSTLILNDKPNESGR